MKDKKKKVIKILFFEGTPAGCIALGILLLFIILYFFSPEAYSLTTARYDKGSEEDRKNVITALGTDNTENDFRLYFQWYNVIHELGHGLLIYNSSEKYGSVEEEQLVNDFAVAYWLAFGEEDKIAQLEKTADYAASHIKSDAADGENYIDFGKNNWNKSSFFTFNNYGWFQFSSTREALKNKKALDEVLKEMGIKKYQLPETYEQLVYPSINEDISTNIINDAVDNFHSWGLKFPKVHHHFSDDPNKNFSRPVKNMRLFDLPAVIY